MDVLNEACSFLETYMHNTRKLMEGLGPQSEDKARILLDKCHAMLSRLEELADLAGPFPTDSNEQPTIVECITMFDFPVLTLLVRSGSQQGTSSSKTGRHITEPCRRGRARIWTGRLSSLRECVRILSVR